MIRSSSLADEATGLLLPRTPNVLAAMHGFSLLLLIIGALSVRAMCPGYLYGISGIPNLGGQGAPGTWRVYDTECNTFATIVAENPCMTPELGCSPSPIIFNRFYFEGKVYTCETSSSSGYCSGNTIQVCCR